MLEPTGTYVAPPDGASDDRINEQATLLQRHTVDYQA
jgi:hypothetical protein